MILVRLAENIAFVANSAFVAMIVDTIMLHFTSWIIFFRKFMEILGFSVFLLLIYCFIKMRVTSRNIADSASDENHMINNVGWTPEKPIENDSDDLLGRGPFVKRLGDYILLGKSSFIVGLHGEFGSGKSSVLNLLEKYLLSQKDKKPPLIIRFNPGSYNNRNHIVKIFLNTLEQGIATKSNDPKKNKIKRHFRKLRKITSDDLSKLDPMIGFLAKICGLDQTLEDTKQKLNEILRGFNEQIVVFIDEIDRLEPHNIRLLFENIRFNTDLPNMTYVLAFNRSKVERILGDREHIDGQEYLEKIINIPLKLPYVKTMVWNVFNQRMTDTINSMNINDWDKEYWENVVQTGILRKFQNIRQVHRFWNGFITKQILNEIETNPIDFVAMDIIHVFAPDVFDLIYESKDILIPMRGKLDYENIDVNRNRWMKDNFEKFEDKKVSGENYDDIRKLVKILFPRIPEHEKGGGRSYQMWMKERRICSPEHFEKYFQLTVPAGEIPEEDINDFIASLDSPPDAMKNIRKHIDMGNIRLLCERLDGHVTSMSEYENKSLVEILLHMGNDLRDKNAELDENLNTIKNYVVSLILSSINEIKTENNKYEFLLKAMKTSDVSHIMLSTIAILEEEITSDLHQKMRNTFVEKVKTANESDTLWTLDGVCFIIKYWERWGAKDDVVSAVSKHIEKDENLILFLKSLSTIPFSSVEGDAAFVMKCHEWEANLPNFLDIHKMRRQLSRIKSSGGEHAMLASHFMEILDGVRA